MQSVGRNFHPEPGPVGEIPSEWLKGYINLMESDFFEESE